MEEAKDILPTPFARLRVRAKAKEEKEERIKAKVVKEKVKTNREVVGVEKEKDTVLTTRTKDVTSVTRWGTSNEIAPSTISCKTVMVIWQRR